MATHQKGEMLTEEQIAEVREIFTLFDKDSDGLVAISELGTMMRALHLNPSEEEVGNWQTQICKTHQDLFDQQEFLTTVAKRGKDTDTLEELEAYFDVFLDGNKDGKITEQKLFFFMTTVGEKMTEAEVREILLDTDIVHDGQINVKEFAKLIMSK